MPNETTQVLETAGATGTDTAASAVVTSSPEVTASTDANNGKPTIEGSSIDDLMKALDAAPSVVAKPSTKPAETATEQTPGGNPAPEATPALETASTTEEEEDEDEDEEPPAVAGQQPPPKTAKNFRLHTEDPKLASYIRTLKAAMKDNPNVDPVEIARAVGYRTPEAQAQAAQAASPAPDPLKGMRDDIVQLEAEIEKAREVEYDHAKALKLERELHKKDRELERAQESIDAQAVADAEYDAGFSAAFAESQRLCPEAHEEGSHQYDLIVAEMQRVAKNNPGEIDDPSYALKVLHRVAAKHPTLFPKVVQKTAPNAAPAALATAKATAGKAAQPTTRPVGTVVPGNNPGPSITTANAPAMLDTLSPEQMIDLANRMAKPVKVPAK